MRDHLALSGSWAVVVAVDKPGWDFVTCLLRTKLPAKVQSSKECTKAKSC